MRYILLLLFQFLALYNQNTINVKALIGENIQRVNQGEFSFVVCIVVVHDSANPVSPHFRDFIVCSGVLISQMHVLIAEHCANDVQGERIQIIAGSIDVRTGTRHNVMWWMTYKQWAAQQGKRTRYLTNDISVIKLLDPVSSEIIPAVISFTRKRRWFGLSAVIAGWGQVNDGFMPLIMRSANVTIQSDTYCRNLPELFGKQCGFFSLAEMCSTAQPYALLECGDSGGPLISENTVVGINIGTIPKVAEDTFHPQQANLHVSTHFYIDFIAEMEDM